MAWLVWCTSGCSNCLPNDKILGWSKLKAFADTKVNVIRKFSIGKVENLVAKGENAGYQHLLIFPLCFSKGLNLRAVKSCNG